MDGVPSKCLIDTGASVSLVPPSFGSGKTVHPCSESIMLRAVNGNPLKVLGKIELIVALRSWEAPHRFLVVETQTGPILGSDFLASHGMIVNMKDSRMNWIG